VDRELLLKELDAQRLLMIAVATGQKSIHAFNDQDVERHNRLLEEMKHLGIDYVR